MVGNKGIKYINSKDVDWVGGFVDSGLKKNGSQVLGWEWSRPGVGLVWAWFINKVLDWV